MFDFISDVVKIVAAPISIASDVAHAVTKPVADIAQEAAKEVKEAVKNITG